uniref:Uncharacterized protein n=1 Tax=viral metagenome TaxID=1070528 RepID=A0A6C0E3I1_9ZZZZ
MHSLFNKLTLKQTLVFVSIVVLFSMFFLLSDFREGLTGDGTNKPQISPGRCDDATTCETCGQIAHDASGSVCYWCGVDKGCKSPTDYYDATTCAKGCRVPPNPPADQQKKYPSTDLTPDSSGKFFPVEPKKPPYNPSDIEACEAPCSWNDKGYCKLGDQACPYKKEVEVCQAPCSWNSKGSCTLGNLPCQYIKPADTRQDKPSDTRQNKPTDIREDKTPESRQDKPADTRQDKPADTRQDNSTNKNKVPEPVSWPLSCQNVSMFRGKIYLNPSDFLDKVE